MANDSPGCWCEQKMTKKSPSTKYKTCFLATETREFCIRTATALHASEVETSAMSTLAIFELFMRHGITKDLNELFFVVLELEEREHTSYLMSI